MGGTRFASHSPTELTIAHNVASKEEVDRVIAQAAQAGARIVKPAQDTSWGGFILKIRMITDGKSPGIPIPSSRLPIELHEPGYPLRALRRSPRP